MNFKLVASFLFTIGIATLASSQKCPPNPKMGCGANANLQLVQPVDSVALLYINTARKQAACGQFANFEKASDIKDLKWDPALASLAAEIARSCDFIPYDCVTKVAPTARQIVHKQGWNGARKPQDVFAAAIESWTSQTEITRQLISSKATKLGCGLSTFKKPNPVSKFVMQSVYTVVCLFDPKLADGQPVSTSGNPPFACPAASLVPK